MFKTKCELVGTQCQRYGQERENNLNKACCLLLGSLGPVFGILSRSTHDLQPVR
jgi:hypothetical protein